MDLRGYSVLVRKNEKERWGRKRERKKKEINPLNFKNELT